MKDAAGRREGTYLVSLSASERAEVSSTSWLNRIERLVRVCERVCLCLVVMLLALLCCAELLCGVDAAAAEEEEDERSCCCSTRLDSCCWCAGGV